LSQVLLLVIEWLLLYAQVARFLMFYFDLAE